MTADLVLERLLTVRSEVERVCRLLASPSTEVLDRCTTLLESACSELASCQPWMSGARGNPARIEALGLHQAIRHASRLLESAWAYHTKWHQTWSAMNTGYTPLGVQPVMARRGLVWMTG